LVRSKPNHVGKYNCDVFMSLKTLVLEHSQPWLLYDVRHELSRPLWGSTNKSAEQKEEPALSRYPYSASQQPTLENRCRRCRSTRAPIGAATLWSIHSCGTFHTSGPSKKYSSTPVGEGVAIGGEEVAGDRAQRGSRH
jgi:hypothetical protein